MLYTLGGLALILLWALATIFAQPPGWIHALLTVGLALAIYGVVKPKSDTKA
ncbi:MAG: hypothetical protein H3C62_04945 [Gemmatimonadaceae bacterium]|nr:hypothetical protein [Gemmatimonadaceae bacterium]